MEYFEFQNLPESESMVQVIFSRKMIWKILRPAEIPEPERSKLKRKELNLIYNPRLRKVLRCQEVSNLSNFKSILTYEELDKELMEYYLDEKLNTELYFYLLENPKIRLLEHHKAIVGQNLLQILQFSIVSTFKSTIKYGNSTGLVS